MGQLEEPQSFVIKISFEENQFELPNVTWHGHITHIPSGQRRYVKSLEDIAGFIRIYLERVGVKFKPAAQRHENCNE